MKISTFEIGKQGVIRTVNIMKKRIGVSLKIMNGTADCILIENNNLLEVKTRPSLQESFNVSHKQIKEINLELYNDLIMLQDKYKNSKSELLIIQNVNNDSGRDEYWLVPQGGCSWEFWGRFIFHREDCIEITEENFEIIRERCGLSKEKSE